jgi:alkyl sulfatase BDS1-like metallo-beta-lactamase superfamily hydrolase
MSNQEVNDIENIDQSVGGTVFERFFTGIREAREVAPQTYFMTADYVNISVFETSDGLLMVDSGTKEAAQSTYDEIRKHTQAPLHTVVYTHGHLDHAFGLKPWLEAGEKPRVIAQENMIARFNTYRKTGRMNAHINEVQFGIDAGLVQWPTEMDDFVWPDLTYKDRISLNIGGERFEVFAAKGETDDASWIWAPERSIVCTGDLWEGMLPNCGNPQKVQRYPEGWADALEAIASVGADILLPGHGKPVEGADTIHECCMNTAIALRGIVETVMAGLNKGQKHEDIIAQIEIPEEMRKHAYLDPLYDRAEFIARNVIRMYGGWWDGWSSNVIPAPMATRAIEVANLAGGASALIKRAREISATDSALACHLAEWAALAEPQNRDAQQCVIDIFKTRADGEISLMGRGIFMHAVRKAEKAIAAMDENA